MRACPTYTTKIKHVAAAGQPQPDVHSIRYIVTLEMVISTLHTQKKHKHLRPASLASLPCQVFFPLLISENSKVNGRHSHLLIHFFFPPLCRFPLSLPLSPILTLFFVRRHGNKSTRTGVVVGGVVLLLWERRRDWWRAGELDVAKWSDSCTHKQRVRWSRRAEGRR